MINPKRCKYCGKKFSSYLINSHEKNCEDNPKNKELRAFELGKQAFHAGNKRSPAFDKNLLFLLGGLGSNERLYRQWLKGWDSEDLKWESITMKKSELRQIIKEVLNEITKEKLLSLTKPGYYYEIEMTDGDKAVYERIGIDSKGNATFKFFDVKKEKSAGSASALYEPYIKSIKRWTKVG